MLTIHGFAEAAVVSLLFLFALLCILLAGHCSALLSFVLPSLGGLLDDAWGSLALLCYACKYASIGCYSRQPARRAPGTSRAGSSGRRTFYTYCLVGITIKVKARGESVVLGCVEYF